MLQNAFEYSVKEGDLISILQKRHVLTVKRDCVEVRDSLGQHEPCDWPIGGGHWLVHFGNALTLRGNRMS